MGEYVQAAKTNDVAPGAAACVDVRGTPIALFNIEGSFFAIGNTCTHRGGPLAEGSIEGDEVTCPWHGARYRISTGEVLSPPAPAGVPKYNVRVQGDDIEIEI